MLFLALAASASTPATAPPLTDQARYVACTRLARSDGAKAIAEAEAWQVAGGGLLARQCLGLAYVAVERWAPAAIAFEQAAREAEIHGDGRAANLWVQAANASLANDEATKARASLDRALAIAALVGPLRGEALMDRARADVALGDLTAARSDLDAALKLVPADPMGWLLSAALARRQGQLDRAAADIGEALRLASNDPDILAEKERIDGMRTGAAAANKAP